MQDWRRAKNNTVADTCNRLTEARYADVARMAQRRTISRTESVAEYLARGGLITKLPIKRH